MIKAWGRTIRSEFHKLINSIWNKEELPEEWKESIVIPIYKKSDEASCSIFAGKLRTKFYPASCSKD